MRVWVCVHGCMCAHVYIGGGGGCLMMSLCIIYFINIRCFDVGHFSLEYETHARIQHNYMFWQQRFKCTNTCDICTPTCDISQDFFILYNIILIYIHTHEPVRPSSKVLSWKWQVDCGVGWIPLPLSFISSKAVVNGHWLWQCSSTMIKTIHIYNAHTPGSLNMGTVSGGDSAMIGPVLVAHVIVRVGGLPKGTQHALKVSKSSYCWS